MTRRKPRWSAVLPATAVGLRRVEGKTAVLLKEDWRWQTRLQLVTHFCARPVISVPKLARFDKQPACAACMWHVCVRACPNVRSITSWKVHRAPVSMELQERRMRCTAAQRLRLVLVLSLSDDPYRFDRVPIGRARICSTFTVTAVQPRRQTSPNAYRTSAAVVRGLCVGVGSVLFSASWDMRSNRSRVRPSTISVSKSWLPES